MPVSTGRTKRPLLLGLSCSPLKAWDVRENLAVSRSPWAVEREPHPYEALIPMGSGGGNSRGSCPFPCQGKLKMGFGDQPNLELLRAVGELQQRCAILKEENQMLVRLGK